MSDRRNSHKIDEELADFTDCLLEGGQTADRTIPTADHDLAHLFETVAFVTRSAPARDPELVMKNRIRATLSAQWHKNGPAVPERKSSRLKTPTLILRFAVIMAVVALAAGLLASQVETVLPGTAQSQGITFVVVLVLMAILGIIFFFWSRHKP